MILLWREQLKFSIISKLENVLHFYDKFTKKVNFEPSKELFSITEVWGEWLNADDSALYSIIPKASAKWVIWQGNTLLILPRDALMLKPPVDTDRDSEEETIVVYGYGEDDRVDERGIPSAVPYSSTKSHSKSAIGTRLLTGIYVSTKQSCENLQTFVRSGHWYPSSESARHLQYTVQESWRNVERRNSKNIAKGLKDTLNEFRVWGAISMVIVDTMSGNTRRKNGEVVRLQRVFLSKNWDKPEFVSCWHHVFHRNFPIIMEEEELASTSNSPNIEYSLVQNLITSYSSRIELISFKIKLFEVRIRSFCSA